MNPLPFHILLALAAADASASETLRRLQIDVQAALMVNERSFYTALRGLVNHGAITQLGTGRAAMYHVTPGGRRRLQAERTRLGHAVQLLRERV